MPEGRDGNLPVVAADPRGRLLAALAEWPCPSRFDGVDHRAGGSLFRSVLFWQLTQIVLHTANVDYRETTTTAAVHRTSGRVGGGMSPADDFILIDADDQTRSAS